MFAYYARSSVRSCRRRCNREKTAGDGTHNNTMQLCIYVLPVPPASAPCARRIAGGLSTRRAINLITGDTFWEPVIGRKPVNRLSGYRLTSLISSLQAVFRLHGMDESSNLCVLYSVIQVKINLKFAICNYSDMDNVQ